MPASSIGVILTVGVPVDAGTLSAELIANDIYGGTAPGGTVGVAVGPVDVSLQGNRIYGGSSSEPSPSSIGISATDPSSLVVYNNLVHGGSSTVGSVVGIACNGCTGAFLEDNTIFAGSAPTGSYGYVVQLLGGTRNVLRGNVLAGVNPMTPVPSDYTLFVDACAEIDTLDNNLFLDTGDAAALGCMPSPLVDISELEAVFPAAVNNLMYGPDCSAQDTATNPPECIIANCTFSCLASLTTWDSATNGFSTLFALPGWALQAQDPCAITRGGVDLSNPAPNAGPAVTTDILSATRPQKPSIGATQADPDAGCSP
jgi:hypothetical protein